PADDVQCAFPDEARMPELSLGQFRCPLPGTQWRTDHIARGLATRPRGIFRLHGEAVIDAIDQPRYGQRGPRSVPRPEHGSGRRYVDRIVQDRKNRVPRLAEDVPQLGWCPREKHGVRINECRSVSGSKWNVRQLNARIEKRVPRLGTRTDADGIDGVDVDTGPIAISQSVEDHVGDLARNGRRRPTRSTSHRDDIR